MNRMEEKDYPVISVVVPIRNEEETIVRVLDQILEQDYPTDKFEIIVVDGESDDGSAALVGELAKKDNRVRLISNPRRLASAGRNIGAREAAGEIITFIDGHTYIDNRRLLRNVAEYMSSKKLDVLSRPQFLETPYNDFFQKCVSVARRSIIGHGLDSTIFTTRDMEVEPTSAGASYKRQVFEKIGYFDERFDACEDVDFNYRAHRADYKSYTSMALAVYYEPRKTLSGLFRQMKRYGTGRFRLASKHLALLSAGTLAPVMLILAIPLLILLSFFRGDFLYPLVILLGLYLALIVFWSVGPAIRHGPKYLLVLPFVYMAIHFGLGWGFVSECFRSMIGRGVSFRKKS